MKHYSNLILLVAIFVVTSAFGQGETLDKDKLKLYGDIRFRTELDRNSMRSDSTMRSDRDRFRYRFRFGIKYSMSKKVEFGGRIRSGNPMNQQSPHITLGDKLQPNLVSIDKVYIKVKSENGLWIWAGKNSMPFWEQNELLWDGDVNPEGIAGGGKFKLSDNMNISPVAGYFIVGNSEQRFGVEDNTLLVGQLKLESDFKGNKLILASGIINGSDMPNKPNGNHSFLMDYNILASSVKCSLDKYNLTFGLDYFANLENYKDDEDIDNNFEDQKTGYVASVKYDKEKLGFGVYYAAIQKYAVVDYLAQDDWIRWGNSEMTRASNFQGFELRAKYKFEEKFNVVLRFYNVEGIAKKTGAKGLETGTRIRLDFNVKF